MDGKISFSFGGKPTASKPAPAAPAGMSNMERLMAQAKAKPAAAPKPKGPSTKGGNIFGDDDDDDGDKPARPAPLSAPTTKKPLNTLLSRTERKAQEEALKIDQSVFDYDGVYDGMKAAERAMEAARKEANADKKPKYIESFLAAAQTRKLDRLRAEEKMLQHEREKEGDEFADKEKFVTEAYKKQMEEVRKAEEEEKRREGESWCVAELTGAEELRKSSKGPGLSGMYASMLDDQAAKHAAAVAASAKPQPGPSLAIRPPTQTFDDEEEYDPLLAREASSSKPKLAAGTSTINAETGKEIEINDEGEIVDKRSLLKAGLNIVRKPGPAIPDSLLSGSRSEAKDDNKPYVSRAVGASASYAERMARERKRLADQVREQEEKKRAAAEARAREEEEAARRRREGDNGEAQRKREEARERALARKRAREEEAAARKRAKEE